ncbi:YkvA family protein [Chitinophagaceae bacterium MMS25-I14]
MSRITSSARSPKNLRHAFGLFQNRRTLWQMIRETLNGRYRMSMLTTVIAVISIAYVLFPFDLLPDYIPVIGWIDDGVVLFLLIRTLNKETQRYIRFKAMERKHLVDKLKS